MDLRTKLLADSKGQKLLTDETLSQIQYINLHAHSTYSLLDAVGLVDNHFVETINQGHCGCCITDHGSYASFIDLYNLKENKKGSKKVKKVFEQKGLKKHDIVMGSELYIVDDRHIPVLEKAVASDDRSKIESVLNSMRKTPKWRALFEKVANRSVISVNEDELNAEKENDLIGTKILRNLQTMSLEVLSQEIQEFNKSSLKTKTNKYNHITILVKNYSGHQNLCYLTSVGSLPENYYMRPRIRLTDLLKNKEGLIITTGCFMGMIPQAIANDSGEADDLVKLFLEEFGDDFYLEMHISDIRMVWNKQLNKFVEQPEGNPQKKVNDGLLEIAKKHGLESKIYITQDSHMPKKEDKDIQDIMILNDTKNKSGWHFYDTYYIMSVREMYEKMRTNYPEYTNEQFINWCFNSLEVLGKCKDVEIDTSFKIKRPDYENHPSVNPLAVSEDYAQSLNLSPIDQILEEERIVSELRGATEEVYLNDKRIDSEKTKLNIKKLEEIDIKIAEIFKNDSYYVQKCKRFYEKDIGTRVMVRASLYWDKFDYKNEKLLNTYFKEFNTLQFNGVLPISDYLMNIEKFSALCSRLIEIPGPGRGSASGCYVNYTLDITNIRPDKYDLLMERFIQKERIGLVYFDHSEIKIPFEEEGDFKYFDELEDAVKNKIEPEFEDRYKEEMFYLECNPGLAKYLIEARSQLNGKILKNERNSYISFLLGITERPNGKISKSSRSMPDIDYDSSCRDLICDYLLKKHGRDHFAYVGSYGSMKLKSALKDILRKRPVNGKILDFDEVNAINKEIDKVKISEEEASEGGLFCFKKIIEENSEVRNFFERAPEIKDAVEKMMGTYKTMGIHAAGVVFTEEPIIRYCPATYHTDKKAYVLQLAKDESEQIGLVKLDLLGLTTLVEQVTAMKLIRERHGVDLFPSKVREELLDNLPPEVANAYLRNDTLGNFQMGTPIAHGMLKKTKSLTRVVEQNSVFTSLGRPGPMGSDMHNTYLDILNGDIPETYLHPSLEPILKDTLSTLVYQEQVMRICQDIGGFSKFDSDSIRKAMGKKKFDILAKYKDKFIDNAVKNIQMRQEIAEEIWNQMAKFAEYGFNKSHAISYSAVSAFSMYLYVVYRIEWITALFSVASKENSEKSKKSYKLYYKEWKDFLKTPSVINSGDDYDIRGNFIYMPLHSLKKVGSEIATEIIKQQPFQDFKDFCLKVRSIGNLRSDSVESLIYGGCMDDFYPSLKGIEKKISGESTEEFLNGLGELEEIVNYAKAIHNQSFDFSGLVEMTDRISNGIRISKKEIDHLRNEILASGILNIQIDAISFRKYLIYMFHSEYIHINIKKDLKEILAEFDLLSPEHVYSILKEGLKPFVAKNPILLNGLKSKSAKKDSSTLDMFSGSLPVEINENKYVDREITENARQKIILQMNDIMSLNPKKLILKQLEVLKFTTYDFSRVFQDEIIKIKETNQTQVYQLDAVNEIADNLIHKLESHFHLASRIIRNESLGSSPEVISIKERLIRELCREGYSDFGYKMKYPLVHHLAREISFKSPEEKFSFQFFREFWLLDDKRYQSETFFNLKVSEFLDANDKQALNSVMGGGCSDLQNINTAQKLPVNMKQLFQILIAKNVLNSTDLCQKFNSYPQVLEMGKTIRDRSLNHKGQFIKAISKLVISEKLEKLFEVGINLKEVGPSEENLQFVKDINKEIEEIRLSKFQKEILKSDFYVFGTVFIVDKKKFLIERGQGDRFQKIMKVTLVDGDSEAQFCVFNAERENIRRRGTVIEKNITTEFKDFTPLIVKSRINLDMRNFDFSLVYVAGPSSVIFIEDSL